MSAHDAAAAAAEKRALRARLLTARATRTAAQRSAAGAALAAAVSQLGKPALAAGFLAVGSEPPTAALLAALAASGTQLIVPILRGRGELDWAPYRPGDAVQPGPRGTLQPAANPLGIDAVYAAELVLVPALAVDRCGRRLGRGGGCYDRTLARLRAGRAAPVTRLTCAIVYDDEVLDAVPIEAHDQRVDAVLTPTGLAPLNSDPSS